MENKLIYITQAWTLSRKDNTLFFENETTKKVIPIIWVEQIYCLSEVSVNSKLLAYLTQNKITLHFCNYNEYYIWSYVPKESYVSWKLLIAQVDHYSDSIKRLKIARAFVNWIGENILFTLKHYQRHWKDVNSIMKNIKTLMKELENCYDITQILSLEGGIWQNFYSSFKFFLPENFLIISRNKRPPDNPMNAMISFWNSLLYTYTLSKIYHTQLNPSLAYLHEPSERRFSLSLDISEVFKIPLVFWNIFYLINKNIININHFDQDLNLALLNDEWRKIFCRNWDERLSKTIDHPIFNKKVSYWTLLKYDCYKLIKHFLGEQDFVPFSLEKNF